MYRPDETSVDSIGPRLGLIRDGAIKSYNPKTGKVKVVLVLGRGDTFNREIECDLPMAWMGQDGEFSGGYPGQGAAVRCMMGQGGEWTVVSYVLADGKIGDDNTATATSFERNQLAAFTPGRYLTQVDNNIRVLLDPEIGIQIGSPNDRIHADPKLGILSNNFDFNMAFTEASLSVNGPLMRDRASNSNRNQTSSALTSHGYQSSLKEIGLDPYADPGDNFFRNPVYAEVRSRVYEFVNSFGFTNDQEEIELYSTETLPALSRDFNRAESRADVLSLSQDTPNLLWESVMGTVADVYGNLLDINRNVLPMGLIESLRFKDNPGADQQAEVFQSLREQNRKTLAYHLELNAQKDGDVSVSDQTDYGRQRSRFFVDIDKEGQIKINIPASSEVGNVALPGVRYENYSEIFGVENDEPKGRLLRNNANRDVFIDDNSVGYVSLQSDSNEELESFAAPTDWIKEELIKLGTMFHDIGRTLQATYNPGTTDDDGNFTPVDPIAQIQGYESVINTFPKVEPVVSESVIVAGEGANAGGRSLTLNLDGSVNCSIGANTVDRQSLWLDTAGGMVANVGRDRNNISLAAGFDGDVLFEIGGTAVGGDSRFTDINNGSREATLEIRMIAGGRIAVFRMSPTGFYMHHPGDIDIVAEGNLRIKSLASTIIDGETVQILDNNGILINRERNRSI